MSRPDEQEPVVFDLVEESEPDTAGDVGEAAPTGSPDPRRPRLPRLSRRTWLVAASVVVVLIATTVTVDQVRDHRRAELMRSSSVGVVSLADPPAETWTVPYDFPAEPSWDSFVDQQRVIMDGLLVLPPGRAQRYTVDSSSGAAELEPAGFEDVTAVDPGSGEVVWRVAVGERPVCGPTGYDGSASADVLVCVHGPGDAREVLTIAPDGSTGSRGAELADGEQIFPGPDGLVVRVERIGPAAEPVECNTTGTCTPAMLADGRDALVTVEDAATGAERWTSIVEFTRTESVNCQEYDPMTGQPAGVDTDQIVVQTGFETIDVDGCGIRGTLSVQGVRLDTLGSGESTESWVTELGGGVFAVQGNGTDTVVVDETGEPLGTLDGWVNVTARSPDAPDGLWIVTDESGYGFDAVREDGSVAWTERSGSAQLVARDVVVVDRGAEVVGLDRTDGEQLWVWSSEDAGGLVRYRTLTDGETVALVHQSQEGLGDGLLVALDLDTGEQLWDAPLTGSPVAVYGHIVELTPGGLTGLG
ncbi:PQQ-binding-like beta-propeller repeat protein [Promicromonospora sp. Populi]|uniref:outer membrane protein assembly factor BamB family protein n=1 Tax=Promicromonospora sp. Populi TaxID=3239420 RepID=UPI0034E2DDE8